MSDPLPNEPEVKTFLQKLNSNFSTLWSDHKVFLIIFGVLIIIAKFSNIMIYILSYLSKKELDNAVKKDGQLKDEQNAANNAANALIKEADELPSKQTPVTPDWYKKDGQ